MWQPVETVSPLNRGWDTAIATRVVQGVEQVRITYYDHTNGDFVLAERTTNPITWWNFTIDSADDVGEGTSVAVDSFGHAAFSYRDATTGNVKIGRWNPYGGTRTVPAPPPGANPLCEVEEGGEGTSLILDPVEPGGRRLRPALFLAPVRRIR